jgi:hypothetical protein
MPVDTSMYNALGARPKSIGEYSAELDMADLRKQGMQQNALALQTGQMGLQDRQRAMQEADTIRNALAGLGGNATDEARINALKGTGLPGGFTQADALQKTMLERQKTTADVSKTQAETLKTQLAAGLQKFEVVGQVMSGVRDQATYDLARQQLAQTFGPDIAQNMPPTYDPAVIEQNKVKAMSVKDQMTQRLQQIQQEETIRHNRAGEGLTASGQSLTRRGQDITMRGQDMTDARTRDLTQVTKENAAAQRKEVANEKAVTKFSDTLQKEGIPDIEAALGAAESIFAKYTDPKTGKLGDVPGVGAVKNALPDWAVSSEGKDVRESLSAVANIVLAARSGAAVTDQELRRLARELSNSIGASPADMQRAYTKFRARFEKIKANAAAGVSDEVKGEYEARGGIPITRGGAAPKAAAPAANADLDAALKQYLK